MHNHTNQVKRYCNFFLILSSLIFISHAAKCAGTCNGVIGCKLSISPIASHTCLISSMNEKKPHNGYTVLLFRAGLEGKTFVFSFIADIHSLYLAYRFTDNALINLVRIKHILSHTDILALPREFLSAFTSHAPPVLC